MELLDIAKEAAKIGAHTALNYFDKPLEVELKEDRSPVTIADKEAEKKIKEYILEQIPHAKFVGEESGGSYDEEEYWLIDPIDGTAYFARGIPLWGTLVTYIQHGKATIGVSYIPFVDELLYAEEGKGAFLNEKRIHVSERKTVKESFITYTTFYKVTSKLPGFSNLCRYSFKAKGLGDSYAFHLLASGKVDAKFDGEPMPFDVAGLNLVIKEAGGKVTNFNGDPWTMKDETVIVSNGLIHDELLKLAHEQSS